MRKKIRGIIVAIMAMIIIMTTLEGCEEKRDSKKLTVSIAASLDEPMKEIGDLFTKSTGIEVIYNVGGSGTLEKQIKGGANVDMFFSANTSYIDGLVKGNYIDKSDVYNILENSLVVIGEKNEKILESLKELESRKGKIAIGETATVPAGMYAKETLEKEKLFNSLNSRFVYGRSVTSVKNYVESGDAEYGFVYKSDCKELKNSKILFNIPQESHSKIVYSLGILKASKNRSSSEEFIEFLKGNQAKAIFEKAGFKVDQQ